MVVLAAILIASPVLAAGSSQSLEAKQGPEKKQTVISMTGTILSISGTQVQIKIAMTNKPFAKYRRTIQLVNTTTYTKFYSWDGRTREPITFSDLKVGDKVAINAKVKDGTFTARRVQRRQPRIR
jgi:hypothetical protein